MLRIERINKKIGDFELRDISFEVKEGEYFVILGPTGTGKTKILEVIAGIYNVDHGNIFINNKNVGNIPPERRNIGFVYQDYLLFPHLSVKQNIIFGLKAKRISKGEIDQVLNQICEMLSIKKLLNRNILTLSGGEQQRVAFARAIVTSPKILLLDEVSSALDPSTKEAFQQNLKKLHKTLKTTTIHVTHDFNEALYLADRIAVMENGQIKQIGTAKEIFNHPISEFVARFTGCYNIFKCKTSNGRAVLTNNMQFVVDYNKFRSEAVVAIRGERISVSTTCFPEYYANTFKGKIIDIVNQGLMNKIKIYIGIEINCFLSQQQIDENNLKLETEVWIGIRNVDVLIL